MPLYEHVMIARQDLSNAQAEGLIEHFGTILKDNGGTVVDTEYWGVKTMAYKINKKPQGPLRLYPHRRPLRTPCRSGAPDAPS